MGITKSSKEKCKYEEKKGEKTLVCKRGGQGPVRAVPAGDGYNYIPEGEIDPKVEQKLVKNMRERLNDPKDREGLDGEF